MVVGKIWSSDRSALLTDITSGLPDSFKEFSRAESWKQIDWLSAADMNSEIRADTSGKLYSEVYTSNVVILHINSLAKLVCLRTVLKNVVTPLHPTSLTHNLYNC